MSEHRKSQAPRATALIVACGLLFGGSAAAARPATVTIAVNGTEIDSGYVQVMLYDRTGWGNPQAEPLRQASHRPADGPTYITLGDIKPGKYVVTAYQDKNSNGRPDAGEPFGMSGGTLGACQHPQDCRPAFKDAAIVLKAGENAVSLDLH